MKKTNVIIVLCLMVVFLFLVRSRFIVNEIKYTLFFESLDSSIEYQIFYTTESSPDFNEENSLKFVSTNVNGEFTQQSLEIFEDETINNIRIDFGATPGVVDIKNIRLFGESTVDIALDEVIKGFNGDITSYELKDDYLEIVSENPDPNTVIEEINLEPNIGSYVNYSKLVDWIIIYFALVGLIIYFISKKMKHKNK